MAEPHHDEGAEEVGTRPYLRARRQPQESHDHIADVGVPHADEQHVGRECVRPT